MPALSSNLLKTLIDRSAVANISTNSTSDALQVICAWPVSGQYGPGSRVLYYVLVAACVIARKSEWLRNACLAAALLFPAVAAIHGIVLAALHVEGAVDMDVYGSFQLCSIGILTASVTVRLSETYSRTPGRNTFFLWTVLILAGLLSLTIEFLRLKSHPCLHTDSGIPISTNPGKFPYNENPTCGLVCTVTQGPFSPMRGGSANNIYVIPAPNKLDFGTATLLAAACCVPAILSLISMWNKILETNWKSRFGRKEEEEADARITGTNATVGTMKTVNDWVKFLLSVVEIPVFGGAVLAILCIGEMNFFSRQVQYQTEPMRSIGQWAPIAGTGIAALGSLYLYLAKDEDEVKPNNTNSNFGSEPPANLPGWYNGPDANGHAGEMVESPSQGPIGRSLTQAMGGQFPESLQPVATRRSIATRPSVTNDLEATLSRATEGSQPQDAGGRRKVHKVMTALAKHLTSAPPDLLDDSGFKQGKARDYPLLPGEEFRHDRLQQITERYNQPRDEHGNVTPIPERSRSRARSFVSNASDNPDHEGSLASSPAGSPWSPQTPRSPSPFPPLGTPRRGRGSGTGGPNPTGSLDLQQGISFSIADAMRDGIPSTQRRDTLEVPSAGRPSFGHTRNSHSASSTPPIPPETKDPEKGWAEHRP